MGGGEESPYDELGYVKTGKVFHLDGIKNDGYSEPHKSDIAYWRELVSDTMIPAAHGSFSWGTDYMSFSGTDITFSNSDIKDAINRDTLTVEMLLEPVSRGASSNNGYITIGSSVRGFWVWDNYQNALSGASYRNNSYTPINMSPWTAQQSIIKLVLSGNDLYVNNRLKTNYTNTGSVTSDACYIGSLNGSGYMNFKLFCLRVYNRLLTGDELQRNTTVDNSRFGL